MKRITPALILVLIAALYLKCQKDFKGVRSGPPENQQPSPLTATLQGIVLDENGSPAEGVRITAGGNSVLTEANGYFRIRNASLDRNATVVQAEWPGYFKAYRSFRATSGVNNVSLKLTKKTLAGAVNASNGGEVGLANGSRIVLPAGSIMDASGEKYTGDVDVYAAYINPALNDIIQTIPGSLMADDKDRSRVVLSSYGMLAVELLSPSGEALQIAAGHTAALTIPIPASFLASAPAVIPMWYIDEQTGLWREQGSAEKMGGSYTGMVSHFSYWNCDVALPAVSFSAILKSSAGLPLKNVHVSVRPLRDSSSGYCHGYSDSLGQVSGLIPANTNLELTVYDQCSNLIYSKNIGPFSRNTDIGTVSIPGEVASVKTISGRLMTCSNDPVTRGYAAIYWNNFIDYVSVDEAGNFSTTVFTCPNPSGIPETLSILGVDEEGGQQGNLATFQLTGQLTALGNIKACGVSSEQFMRYTLDGKDYSILPENSDSLVAYSIPSSGTTVITYVQCRQSEDNAIWFQFTGNAVAGNYPVQALNVRNFNRVALKEPFEVSIAAFPKNPGEFYEGSFSGSFADTSAISVMHTISCSFRIKRY